jgi:hypothetical protein
MDRVRATDWEYLQYPNVKYLRRAVNTKAPAAPTSNASGRDDEPVG